MNIEHRPMSDLIPYINNARIHDEQQINQVAASIKEFGFTNPVLIDTQNGIIAGHGRVLAARKLNIEQIPCIVLKDLSEAQKKAYIIADNKLALNADWDEERLKNELERLTELDFDLDLLGFDDPELNCFLNTDLKKEEIYTDYSQGNLKEKFIVPPFSIFDTRQGYWQDRKLAWKSRIGCSQKGRKNELLLSKSLNLGANTTNTSEFDPVLCEVLYNWYAPERGNILDPFSGGHTRGSVAGSLNFKYLGIDLRDEQIKSNNNVIDNLFLTENIKYIAGNSEKIDELVNGLKFDFILSCPPYHDLEKYSSDPEDLSNMDYKNFINSYSIIIKKTCALLNNDCFACFVVSDIRDKKGIYRNFVDKTKSIFIDSGLDFYNEIILLNVAGSAPLRASRIFKKSRKVSRLHQNVLIFIKGDPVKATKKTKIINDVDLSNAIEEKYGEVLES